jgi:hypothetical protein
MRLLTRGIRRVIRFKDCDYELFQKAAAKNKQDFSDWYGQRFWML